MLLVPSRRGALKTTHPVGIQEVNHKSRFMVLLSFNFPTSVFEVAPGHLSLGKVLIYAIRTSYSSFL